MQKHHHCERYLRSNPQIFMDAAPYKKHKTCNNKTEVHKSIFRNDSKNNFTYSL